MAQERIDGIRLYDTIMSGANNLINHERNLNGINVFPVPDGDTGTNLALTMRTIINKAERKTAVHQTLGSIGQVALENAYGNSGMIFAQYFIGLAQEAGQRESLSAEEFSDIANKAVRHAYEAVASPKEGTILTVMREWAADMKVHLHLERFDRIFEISILKAAQIVEQTKTMMRVLMENNVVDSGAKGFLFFLEGMLAYLRSGKPVESGANWQIAEEEQEAHAAIDFHVTQNRYCSQFVFESEFSKGQIVDMLAGYGDSLVVTGSGPIHQIHLHSDVPQDVMHLLVREGQVISHKVDDMALQTDVVHRRKYKIGLVTDSIADMSKAFQQEEQISVIPLNIICDGTAYLDKTTMTPEVFYRDVDGYRWYPSSAQPTISAIESRFEWMQAHYESVIGIFVSGKMSGLMHNAIKVAERLSQKGPKITVIDSLQNSAAEGLLVMEASRLIREGKSHDEIVDTIEAMAKNTRILVSVDTLKYMIRGGRVSKLKGFILSKLNLKPIISIDETGKGMVYAKTRSRKQAYAKIQNRIEKDKQQGILGYGVVYSESRSDAEPFCRMMEKQIGAPPRFVEQISPVVALNAGKGAYAVAYIRNGG